MAKKYVCDICGDIVENPYAVRMVEFYIGAKIDFGSVFPEDCKGKRRIHVCPCCKEDFAAFVKERRGIV